MKKLLCIFLSAILIIGTCVFAVNAAENPKISISLEEALNNSADDVFSVYISLKPITSESEVERIVAEKYTWASAQEHLKYYRAELKNIVAPYVQQFIDDNSELLENILYQGKTIDTVIADVKRENIPVLANVDIVTELSYFENLQPENEAGDYVFQDAFVNWAVSKYGEDCFTDGYEYNELYTHYNGGKPDWVLVRAEFLLPAPSVETWVHIGGIGGRTVFGPSLGSPFMTGYGIYDVEENAFYGLENMADDYSRFGEIGEWVDYTKYEGLIDALADIYIGTPTGDANSDDTLDVLDATEIQKASVDKVSLTKKQTVVADVNSDNRADVLDATAIQKALVAE